MTACVNEFVFFFSTSIPRLVMLDFSSTCNSRDSSQHSSAQCCHTTVWSDEFHSLEGIKIMPHVFCHPRRAYTCSHSPCVDKCKTNLSNPYNVICKPPNVSHLPIPKVVMVSACTFNCISMHGDMDEVDTSNIVDRQHNRLQVFKVLA